jgi:AbrB family looped-hinge helix DNA binding protein
MSVVRTLAKGQVVIPKALRQSLGITPGTRLHVRVEGGALILVPLPDDPIRALRGIARGGPSLTRALLDDRKEDREREEKKLARLLRRPRLGSR